LGIHTLCWGVAEVVSAFEKFHGQSVVHPLTGRSIPIICDPVLVDMSFGTGVVKVINAKGLTLHAAWWSFICMQVTPSHDPNDFQCGQRHKLPSMNILNPDGTLNEQCGIESFVVSCHFLAYEFLKCWCIKRERIDSQFEGTLSVRLKKKVLIEEARITKCDLQDAPGLVIWSSL
jgi:valyl-tRNA synthetase